MSSQSEEENMNAQHAPAARSEAAVHPVTCRISRSRDLGGCLAVTVETSKLLLARRAIVRSGCKNIGIVKATPLGCGTRVRLLIAMRPESFARVTEELSLALAADRD
jgi:hypothetical protein